MRLLTFPSLLMLAILGVSYAQPMVRPDASQFVIRNLEVANSLLDEYAPYVTPDGLWLYFTSARAGRSDIYRSRRSADQWASPELSGLADVNTPDDDGAFYAPIPALAELMPLDEAMMDELNAPTMGLLTTGERDDGSGSADLYVMNVAHNGMELSNVRPFPVVSTKSWDAQGTMAPDGSFIIFSSDRPDGIGGMDLYISMLGGDQKYSEPVNLGQSVNTSDNEFSPFIASDGRTMFFASTGYDGFGGADLYRTMLQSNGTWSAPVNLGDKINTSANELFFFGVGRERCFFVSDRPGGKGGLDLYEAQPNIFARGYSDLKIIMTDTTTGRPVSGRLRVVENTLGRTIVEMPIPDAGVDLSLFAGSGYRLEFIPTGFPPKTISLTDLRPDTAHPDMAVKFGSIPAQPEFIFNGAADVDLRWFVSGYYRVNTPAHLEELRQKQRKGGELKKQSYIASVASNDSVYQGYAQQAGQVERILQEFYRHAVEDYFPTYTLGKKPDEYLEITVYGYADPRPIIGNYVEKPVTFYSTTGEQVSVNAGESLTNFKLAGLRAYYAMEFFDRMFRDAALKGHPEYRTLADKGLIRWRPVSGDVDTSNGDDLAQSRRVKIDFKRMSGDGREMR